MLFIRASTLLTVQTLPKPKPDLLEPEPMVQFRVQGNPLNWSNGPVTGSAKNGKEPDQTKLSQHYMLLHSIPFVHTSQGLSVCRISFTHS